MEKRFKISEFAELVGASQKAIYSRINNAGKLPDNEKLRTVNEYNKGREIAFIYTDDEQIRLYQNIFGKLPVNEVYCEDILTDNEVNYHDNEIQDPAKNNYSVADMNEVIDKIITLNDNYNERLMTVNDELMKYKSQTLLLEDKAGREGLYLSEIKELKKVNERKNRVIYSLITVIVILLLILTGYFTYQFAAANLKAEKPAAVEIEQVKEIQLPVNNPTKTVKQNKKAR